MTRQEILKVAKPILFNTEMVRAIMDDRKTVTRRVLKLQPYKCIDNNEHEFVKDSDLSDEFTGFLCHKCGCGVCSPHGKYPVGTSWIRPKYKVSDYLYVRETWGIYEQSYMDANYILYRADFPNGAKTFGADCVSCDLPTWRPSIHMPKAAARIFLRVTDVRVERLSEITDEQALKEGLASRADFISTFLKIYPSCTEESWVWVVSFERVEVEP